MTAKPDRHAQARPATRIEHDPMGPIDVPALALWGAQTERSRRHFAFGEPRMPLALIHAMAEIKQAAAHVHARLGLLPPERAAAIAEAAARVAQGDVDEAFPLSVWQTGSGTQSHMNVNEVIANLASVALGGGMGEDRCVHPNDDVNRGQSSNDVVPTAMHLAALQAVRPLLAELGELRLALRERAAAWHGLVKVGRTHLQDAAPVTLGQEFGAYASQLDGAEDTIRASLPALHQLAIGGTAVGTGLNTHPDFAVGVVAELSARHATTFAVAADRHAAMSSHEPLVRLHAGLRQLAIALTKIGHDIRLMGSGPRAGLGELRLPANEPGSSMMPGKVNPTQVEALCMVCAQVMGHDVAIGIAASQGQFELNACKPLIVHDLLDSLRLLGAAMGSFRRHCIAGLQADEARIGALVAHSLMGVTALVPHVGHDRAAAIARHAVAQGLSLGEAALAVAGLGAAELAAWTDPARSVWPAAPTPLPPRGPLSP
ncbi:class II fumarate hydratase [Leptothrix discophora]|uniref:Fumarate hydratase class II n=1 Tax=Leptothrix discophora TaxID=89 RepID=A0ABT9G988_LEPDI|nr:class II fumarate hydratase [Leptothrix discophora]MDP4302793.1 class II fumarate hydratase [Leptothrix discophora]